MDKREEEELDRLLPSTDTWRDATCGVFTVETSGLTWLAVHGALALALRHPGYTGPSRALVLSFLEELGHELVRAGVLNDDALQFAKRYERQHSPHGDS